jgi:hypothetical protein
MWLLPNRRIAISKNEKLGIFWNVGQPRTPNNGSVKKIAVLFSKVFISSPSG